MQREREASVIPAAPHPKVAHGKVGVLLLNLGTPDATDYWSMRRYLKEFLSDRRVIEEPRNRRAVYAARLDKTIEKRVFCTANGDSRFGTIAHAARSEPCAAGVGAQRALVPRSG